MGWKGFRLPLERQAEKASVFLPQKDKYFLYKLCHEQKKKLLEAKRHPFLHS
jgi:hypothetical protein